MPLHRLLRDMELSGYFLIGQIFLPAFPEYFTAFIRQKRHRFFYQMMKFLQLQFRIIVLHNLHTLHFFQINRNLLVPDIGKRLIACRLEQIGFQGQFYLKVLPVFPYIGKNIQNQVLRFFPVMDVIIKFKNTYALLSFSDAACGKKTTRDSYTQFLCKMRAKHIRQISFYLFKYAAIITLLIIFAYQAGVNQHSEILQENIENKLHVPAGQRIKLTLQDGTTVWLNSHTTLTYPAIFDKKERRVAIDGEAFFIVAQDKHKPFIVSSQGIETKVLGTQFNICSYRKNNDVRTSLIEGSLQIYFTGKENESIILSPNEQISIKNGTIKVDTISHHDYFLWKEGIYSFKDELLVDILNKLQLYYDVRIIIRNPSINQEKYTGKFRQRDSIDDILRMLQKIHKFKIQKDEENNIITLS